MKTAQFRKTPCRVSLIFSMFFYLANMPMSWADSAPVTSSSSSRESALFAGGCFWCLQPPFDALKGKGVISTAVGYSGGHKDLPKYEEVSAGTTGHREVLEVIFDPSLITYQQLLLIFWRNIDPFDKIGQFCDKGEQYRSAVYFTNEAQRKSAEVSKENEQKSLGKKTEILTDILPAKKFFPAEDYHQEYYLKNPVRYKLYRFNCGRDARLKAVWGSSGHH